MYNILRISENGTTNWDYKPILNKGHFVANEIVESSNLFTRSNSFRISNKECPFLKFYNALGNTWIFTI